MNEETELMLYKYDVAKEGHVYNYACLSNEEKLIYMKIKCGEVPPTMLQFCSPTE